MGRLRLVVVQGACLAVLAGCCLHPGSEDAGPGASTGSGGGSSTPANSGSGSGASASSGSSSGTGGTSSSTSASDGGNACWAEAEGVEFCGIICGSCLYGLPLASCQQILCPACNEADVGDLNSGLGCGAPPFCSLAALECLKVSKGLSPSCRDALHSVVESSLGIDGGTACYPDGSTSNFCSAIAACVGGLGYCEQAICGACTVLDGYALDADGGEFFGGLCPPISPANPCADFECFIDAGTQVLSPGCAAALASLVERFWDGGVDGG